jgi:very-short-patch-repair endonuclease
MNIEHRKFAISKAVEYQRLNPNNFEKFVIESLTESRIGFIHQIVFWDNERCIIPDFFVETKKLIIEIDGFNHFLPQAIIKDDARDEYLLSLGYSVARFTNKQALEIPNKIADFVISHIFDRPFRYDMRIKPKRLPKELKYAKREPISLKSSDGRSFTSINQAANFYKISSATIGSWFRDYETTTYTSKTGITLTKTELK